MSFKTLHITNAWHATSGGISTFYRALLQGANHQGHLLRLIVPGESTREEAVGSFGKIYHLKAPHAPLNRCYRMLYPGRFLWPKTAIHRILQDEQPDLIEICDKYSLPYLAGLLRIQRLPGLALRPTVVGLTCERMDENLAAYLSAGAAGRWFCRAYMKWIYFPQFDHHLAVSEHVAAELMPASRGHKVKRGVWTAPMGVDDQRFSPALRSREGRSRLVQRCGAKEDSVILLYAGRLVPEKNLRLLISTLESLRQNPGGRDYRLVIAGEGMLLNEFRRECENRVPAAVTFLGHLAGREELARLYADADAFVHPNPREPFGIAPLEAMASGLALVAPDCGGVLSFANAGNAWLAPPAPETFADAVRSLYQDPALRRHRIAAALITAQQHSWSAVTARFLELYRELHQHRLDAKSRISSPLFYSTPGNRLGFEI